VNHRGLQAIGIWGTGSLESSAVRFAPPMQGLWLRRTESEDPSPSGEGSESSDGQGTDRPSDAGEEQDRGAGAADAEQDAAAGKTHALDPTAEVRAAPGGITYREWDEYAGRYREDEVTVQARIAGGADETWAVASLRAHAPLVRQVRARFAPLRAQRTRLRAQRAGDELDLDACVAALVDMRRGHLPDDRLYRLTRPARRTLAIMLLVDVSGSTNARLADGRTVLDVERLTLLLASEALEELGDPYAVLAFSSSGRHDVQVDTVKAFADADPAAVRRRISALASARNTRLGAAVRHATAVLNAQPAERRLLLLLSDGQPNDVGGYQGSYAVGDSRRAVLEARASGVHPFCLTVDREEQEYLPHLFGTNGYRVLRDPSHLPSVLLQVVTQLLPG
jgi:nitric oxide reductase NorD protein